MSQDQLHLADIEDALGEHAGEYAVTLFSSVSSTNTLLKEKGHHGACSGTVFSAEYQSAGRGRLGRSFFSPPGRGLYFSLLVRPALPMARVPFLTTAAAVAVARGIERSTGLSPRIKWVNDLFLRERKICGILCEASPTPEGNVDFAVIGIGLNVVAPEGGFGDLEGIAGALFQEPMPGVRSLLLGNILSCLSDTLKEEAHAEVAAEYKARSLVIGREVMVEQGNLSYPARVLDIDSENRLVIQTSDNTLHTLSSGEIRIHL